MHITYLLGLRIHARALTYILTYLLSYLLTYLLNYTVGSVHIKPAISPKWLKIERKLLLTAYIKLYTGFRLPPKCMTLKWPLREIQGHWFLKCRKMPKHMTPTPCRVAGGIISIRPTYSCARASTYLLIQNKLNNQCFGLRLPTGLWSSFLTFQLISK